MGGTLMGLSACGQLRFPVTSAGQQDLPARDITVIRVTGENIATFSQPVRAPVNLAAGNPPPNVGRYSYRVGAGDTLRITFFADPAGITSPTEFAPETVAVIDEAGRFFYPFLGTVQAEGRTVGQIRADLTERLSEFFATPQVEVAVVEFNARRVIITGAVGAQGQQILTNVPTTLLDLVNTAGVLTEADLSRIEIRRGGQVYTANLLSFLEQGTRQNNPVLLPDDLIRVPIAEENKVFTFGEIDTGITRLTTERTTLLDILAESGGINRIRADARGIFIFRRDDPTRGGFDVYQFDLSNAAALVLAAEFGMAPLDIVFVTNDPATRWNDTITKIVGPFNTLITAQTTVNQLGDIAN